MYFFNHSAVKKTQKQAHFCVYSSELIHCLKIFKEVKSNLENLYNNYPEIYYITVLIGLLKFLKKGSNDLIFLECTNYCTRLKSETSYLKVIENTNIS